jgi:hypothetical protein
MALERELRTYTEKLPELLAQEGKYVLIHQDEVAGTFDTFADAVQAGYERFDLDQPFLVKEITAVEPVHFIGFTRCRI